MSLNVEEPYKEEEVLYQVQVRLNSRGRERVLKVKVYDCAPPLYIHSCSRSLLKELMVPATLFRKIQILRQVFAPEKFKNSKQTNK